MPPPKDPIKYAEYLKHQSESHIGKFKGKNSPRFGKKHSKETLRKMSDVKKGKYDGDKNPFYGKKHSEETLKNLSQIAKNRPDEVNKKIGASMMGKPAWNKGIPVPEATRKKSSDAQKGDKSAMFGKPKSKKTRKLMSDAAKGKPKSEETCIKISISRTGKCCKENNPNWNNGSSFFPYCPKDTPKRHRATSNYFGDRCIVCGKHVTENILKNGKQVALSIHHTDHDKEQGCNGKPFNLVPLCTSCHGKELAHKEEYKAYINKTLNEGFKWGIWSKEQYKIEVMYP
jgi:cytochrome c553